jgi:DNA-binding HxlR family transcriptional regulator
MALGKDYETQDCSLARALELVGERWTLLIIRDAFYGVRRYSDFVTHLGVPRAVLAERLQALTAAGVLEKQKESGRREEYVLTEMGRGLWPALHALSTWGVTHLAPNGPAQLYVHVPCGTRLDLTGACPVCGGPPVRPEDIEMRPGPGARPPREDPISQDLSHPHRLLTPLPAANPERALPI